MSDKRVKEDYFTFAKLKAWSQASGRFILLELSQVVIEMSTHKVGFY